MNKYLPITFLLLYFGMASHAQILTGLYFDSAGFVHENPATSPYCNAQNLTTLSINYSNSVAQRPVYPHLTTANDSSLCYIVETPLSQGIADVDITHTLLNGSLPFLHQTNADGAVCTNDFAIGSTVLSSATLNTYPKNGVNAYDHYVIARHILGIAPLVGFHQKLAADANRSGSVTTFDIVESRKLVLGIYNEFPNNSSWRMLLPNSGSGLSQTVLTGSDTVHFVGVKVGDVDYSANPKFPDLLPLATDTLDLLFDNEFLQAGTEKNISLQWSGSEVGIQFTLNHHDLEVLEVLPSADMTIGNFALWGNSTTVCSTPLSNGMGLKVKVLQSGWLSDKLSLSHNITPSFAYTPDGTPIGLRLASVVAAPEVNENHFQATIAPNPWRNDAILSFNLLQSGPLAVTIVDQWGRVVYQSAESYSAGLHKINLANSVRAAGFYTCHLAQNNTITSIKMVKID